MPDLLLELFSEEIPARMQRKAAEDLRKLVTDALVAAGLVYEGAKAFVTPRRLTLAVHGLPARSPERREERKGPRVGAPSGAIDGFLKAAGLASIAEAKVQADKKGDFYIAVTEKPGRAAEEVIAGIVPGIVRAFPWPKSMRWGIASAPRGTPYYGKDAEGPEALSWVRPLHSILCTFGPETEEPEVVAFSVDGIRAGNVTYGHRFMAPEPISVRRLDDYMAKLDKAKVVLDADRRKDIILHGARDQALALGLELVEDEGLLEEVAGLVEWPVVLVGSFDEKFLEIPPEVIRATIRANQKCFVLKQATRSSSLAPRFILVANIEASDGGKAIVAGNERVIRARLADARYFWETDLKPLAEYRDSGLKPLDQRLEKLKAQNIVFHEKLGTQGERIERIVRLAGEIADALSSRPDFFTGKKLSADELSGEQQAYRKKVERAAHLAKADLVSEMVGEFPELQGLMGRYYAVAQGEDPSVAAAIEDHYKPLGPSDRVPTDPVAIAVALADKLDMLVGFWAIDEKPTGSKDPYALRRAALGVIRLLVDNRLRLPLDSVEWDAGGARGAKIKQPERLLDRLLTRYATQADIIFADADAPIEWRAARTASLLSFFAERLKVLLREQGARHDLVDAVLALGDQDDLLMIVRRVEALGRFLEAEDGKNLLTGYRRAANILRDEEKKSGTTFDGVPEFLQEPSEIALSLAINAAIPAVEQAAKTADFEKAMAALAKLRLPVDAFFDKVLVNDPDPELRANRLKLLNRIREATRAVADFDKIAG